MSSEQQFDADGDIAAEDILPFSQIEDETAVMMYERNPDHDLDVLGAVADSSAITGLEAI